MVSRKLATAQLQKLSEAYSSSTSGIWIPEYHSISAIDSFNSHFDELSKKAEDSGRDIEDSLGPEELAWIDNEFRICACDDRYWMERYAYINADGNIQRFVPRASQSMVIDTWAEREESGSAIEQQWLKARQQGFSTLAELEIAKKVNFGVGIKAAVASYDQDAGERMGGMMELAFNMMPNWMKAQPTSNRAGSLKAFGGLNNRLTLYSGKKASGIARGDTPNVIHISEVSVFPDASNVIEKSLFNAVHPSANTFMVLESTGNGNTDWWARTWYSSRDYWETGGARLQPIFCPWFVAYDIFPTPTWRKDHPVPNGWESRMLPETRRMMAKAAAFVHQTPLLRRHMGDQWRMEPQQAYYWEQMLLEARRKNEENSWYQEMPMDDCVTGETKVSTENGIVRIDEAMTSHSTECGEIIAWTPKGKREIYEVHTNDGRILRATPEHRVQTGDTWTKVEDLKPGDRLTLSKLRFASDMVTHTWYPSPLYYCQLLIDEKVGRFLGYFMGDGCFNSSTVDIACDAKDSDIVEQAANLLHELSGNESHIQVVNGLARVRNNSKHWRNLLEAMGCLKTKYAADGHKDGMNRKVCVPEVIFKSPRRIVREFLSALFECDGHANKTTPRVSLYSSHDDFLRDVQILLLGFGIRSKLDKLQKKNGNGRTYMGRELVIPAHFANLFYENVGFLSKRKQESGMRQNKSRAGHSAYSGFCDYVKEVVKDGKFEEVYDLTIASTHKFSANGIIVHNCEALRPTKDLVFNMMEISKQDETRSPYECYSIIGEQIQECYHPDPEDIDYDKERFDVSFDGYVNDLRGRISKTFCWQLVPLRQPVESGIDLFDPERKLLIFRMPEPGYTYSIGVDNSAGVGRDGSYISVNGKSLGAEEPDFQAAAFWTNQIDPSLMHPYIMAIFCLYQSYMPTGTGPVVAIEQVYGLGDTPQIQMMAMGFHKRNIYHFSRLDGVNPEADKKKSHRPGWFTVDWSRNFLLTMYRTAIHNHWRKINDPFLLKHEIPAFQIDKTEAGRTRWDHQDGKRDDRIFGDAISFIILNDTESMTRRVQNKFEGDKETFEIDYNYPVGVNSSIERMCASEL